MGDAHGIYNASNESLRWLNFAVSSVKGSIKEMKESQEFNKLKSRKEDFISGKNS